MKLSQTGEETDWDASSSSTNYPQDLEKSFNTNRKFEARERNLTGTKQTRTLQCEQYQEQLSATFPQQMRTFNAEMKKVDEEIAEVQTQKNLAIRTLTSTAAGEETGQNTQKQRTPLARDHQSHQWSHGSGRSVENSMHGGMREY